MTKMSKELLFLTLIRSESSLAGDLSGAFGPSTQDGNN